MSVPNELLTTSNYKTKKGEKFGYETHILNLAPSNLSGTNTCPSSSKGCAAACLNTSGLANCEGPQNARIVKTKYFFEHRAEFMKMLNKEINRAIKKSTNKGLIPTFRLNGTSDIRWEEVKYGPDNKSVFEQFPDQQFYDYTKIPNRYRGKPLPSNYQLVFSRSEENDRFVNQAMQKGQNVAVVFGDPPGLPNDWRGWPVIDGDVSDLRFLDPPRSVVGLKAKGLGKLDTTGFVIYGDGMLDIKAMQARSKKEAVKSTSRHRDLTIGQRKFGTASYVPIQSKVSKQNAERTAEVIRGTGRNARVIEHRPIIGGKKVTAYAVYTPGAYSRLRSGAIHSIQIRAPSRFPLPR